MWIIIFKVRCRIKAKIWLALVLKSHFETLKWSFECSIFRYWSILEPFSIVHSVSPFSPSFFKLIRKLIRLKGQDTSGNFSQLIAQFYDFWICFEKRRIIFMIQLERKNKFLPHSLTSLDISDLDTVWTWGGQTSTPPISKYFSEICSPR